MAGKTLTVASSLSCPHGATVTIVPSNTRAKADGNYIATAADTFTIAGCPFTPADRSTTPSPCIMVIWSVTDELVKAGAPTLSQSSQGLCISALGPPQGPVIISSTQTKVSSK
jgi:hypothetical protein